MSYKVPFVDYPAQYNAHKEELDEAISSVIQRGDLILRQDGEDFEKSLANFLNVKHVIAVANGTDALHLALIALGVGEGDEIITTSYTFRATVEASLRTGAKVILADLNEDWRLYKTENTVAIIPAHLEGCIVPWEPDEGIHMIEDSCQAIGGKAQTGIMACYSFYPAKILGCLGDGGAIATNDDDLAHELRQYRNHDKGERSFRIAYNSRLDNLQASVLNVRLKYLQEALTRRKEIGYLYEGLKLATPPLRDIYQDYIIKIDNPTALAKFLDDNGIQTMKNGYDFPLFMPKKPKAEHYEEHSLRLPCNETLTDEQVLYVVEKVNEYVRTMQ